MSTNIKFTENLIKGKIAEIIFENMLREAGVFTVMHFGYEYILPELTRGNGINKESETMKSVRSAPDFAIINNKTKEVRLIEVKYKKELNRKYILEDANKMAESWNPSYIFLATKSGFYFDNIADIIKANGNISELHHLHISKDLQNKYLDLLNKMEQ